MGDFGVQTSQNKDTIPPHERLQQRLEGYRKHHSNNKAHYEVYANAEYEKIKEDTKILHQKWLEGKTKKNKGKSNVKNEFNINAISKDMQQNKPKPKVNAVRPMVMVPPNTDMNMQAYINNNKNNPSYAIDNQKSFNYLNNNMNNKLNNHPMMNSMNNQDDNNNINLINPNKNQLSNNNWINNNNGPNQHGIICEGNMPGKKSKLNENMAAKTNKYYQQDQTNILNNNTSVSPVKSNINKFNTNTLNNNMATNNLSKNVNNTNTHNTNNNPNPNANNTNNNTNLNNTNNNLNNTNNNLNNTNNTNVQLNINVGVNQTSNGITFVLSTPNNSLSTNLNVCGNNDSNNNNNNTSTNNVNNNIVNTNNSINKIFNTNNNSNVNTNSESDLLFDNTFPFGDKCGDDKLEIDEDFKKILEAGDADQEPIDFEFFNTFDFTDMPLISDTPIHLPNESSKSTDLNKEIVDDSKVALTIPPNTTIQDNTTPQEGGKMNYPDQIMRQNNNPPFNQLELNISNNMSKFSSIIGETTGPAAEKLKHLAAKHNNNQGKTTQQQQQLYNNNLYQQQYSEGRMMLANSNSINTKSDNMGMYNKNYHNNFNNNFKNSPTPFNNPLNNPSYHPRMSSSYNIKNQTKPLSSSLSSSLLPHSSSPSSSSLVIKETPMQSLHSLDKQMKMKAPPSYSEAIPINTQQFQQQQLQQVDIKQQQQHDVKQDVNSQLQGNPESADKTAEASNAEHFKMVQQQKQLRQQQMMQQHYNMTNNNNNTLYMQQQQQQQYSYMQQRQQYRQRMIAYQRHHPYAINNQQQQHHEMMRSNEYMMYRQQQQQQFYMKQQQQQHMLQQQHMMQQHQTMLMYKQQQQQQIPMSSLSNIPRHTYQHPNASVVNHNTATINAEANNTNIPPSLNPQPVNNLNDTAVDNSWNATFKATNPSMQLTQHQQLQRQQLQQKQHLQQQHMQQQNFYSDLQAKQNRYSNPDMVFRSSNNTNNNTAYPQQQHYNSNVNFPNNNTESNTQHMLQANKMTLPQQQQQSMQSSQMQQQLQQQQIQQLQQMQQQQQNFPSY